MERSLRSNAALLKKATSNMLFPLHPKEFDFIEKQIFYFRERNEELWVVFARKCE